MHRHIPKYRCFKPKNLGLVVINGRQHYLGRYGTPESVAEYNRLIQEFLAGGSTSRSAASSDGSVTPLSVNEMILAFWRHAELHYRHSDGTSTGELRNFRDSLRPLRKLHGNTAAREFSPKGLKAVRQAMIDSGLCRNTINRRVGRIVHVFNWAVSEELIPVAVHQALKSVSGLQKGRTSARETEPIQPVSDIHVEAIRS
jgi:predicted ATP-grasp superfamily ATP-dependent carboligase